MDPIKKRVRRRATSLGNTDRSQQTLVNVWKKIKEKADQEVENKVVMKPCGTKEQEPDGHVGVYLVYPRGGE